MLYILENSRHHSSHVFYFVQGYSGDRDRIDAVVKADAASDFPTGLKYVAIADTETWFGNPESTRMSVAQFVEAALSDNGTAIRWCASDWDEMQAKIGPVEMLLLGVPRPADVTFR